MGALHQPDLEPGAHRDLVAALHRLHGSAGSPSLRTIARRAGCSHTTVSHVLSHPQLPVWDSLEAVVRAMSGDPSDLRELWLEATNDGAHRVPPPGRAIAGRRAELLVVRRHLETGSGLLVVAGSAGVGKTTLVATAAQQVSTFVARAGGLPPTADAPFALLTDVLRAIRECDRGRWLDEAIARCPALVRASLWRVLPELGPPASVGEDRFATDQLFAAISSTLSSLAALRPLALVLEDLHWSDPSSRAFVERQVIGGRGVAVVGTIRSGESARTDEWLRRVRREASLQLNLAPLTVNDTRELLHLLIGPRLRRSHVERVHRLSGGVALFIEDLARSMTPSDPSPRSMVAHVSAHLDGLSTSARSLLVVAALAHRPLPPEVVATVAMMGPDELDDARRELVRKHLLADVYTTTDVAVRHPLVAAIARAHLVPGDAAPARRRLATSLAASAHPSAAEVAGHWQGGQDLRQELSWRVTAAREACVRLARDEEAVHWERVLELWPADGPAPLGAGITRSELLLEVAHAMVGAGRTRQAGPWVEEALATAPSHPDRRHGLALRRAGKALVGVDPDLAARVAARAAEVLLALDDPLTMVSALGDQSAALRGAGRYADAERVVGRAIAVSATLDEPALHRDLLIELAWLHVAAGRTVAGLRVAREARSMVVEGDPFGDVWLATYHTDLLLMRCASGDEVADAADFGLAAVRDAGIESSVLGTALLCNVALARINEGAVGSASRLIRPRTHDAPRQATRFLHLARAWIEVLRGELEPADRRLAAVAELTHGVSAHRQLLVTVQAHCDLWRGLPAVALDHIGSGIAGETVTCWTPYTGTLLVLAARAAADVAQADPSRRVTLGAALTDWHRQWSSDPLAPDATHAAAAATRSTWRAELGRLAGTAHVTDWIGAAEQWDLVGRPHDAAYCQWQAAELARRQGSHVRAARLLRHAHAQARGHVPLLALIDRSRAELADAPRVPAAAGGARRAAYAQDS